MLFPVSVKVPVPDFVSWSALVPFCNTPLKVVLALLFPTATVAAVALLFNTVPVPESKAIVLLNP